MPQPPQFWGSPATSAQVVPKPCAQQTPGPPLAAAQSAPTVPLQVGETHWFPTQTYGLWQGSTQPPGEFAGGRQTGSWPNTVSGQTPEGQATPQPPQFSGSCWGSTQAPPQQRPGSIPAPKAQATPEAPAGQLDGRHSFQPVQIVPGGQPPGTPAQPGAPPSGRAQDGPRAGLQSSPVGQTTPQPLQLVGLLWTSTQLPPQHLPVRFEESGQATPELAAPHAGTGAHCPWSQKLPAGQAFPQPPQLAPSCRRSTQALLQQAPSVVADSAQGSIESPGPQLWGASMQPTLAQTRPGGQLAPLPQPLEHCPAMQAAPTGHATPQLPQFEGSVW